MRPTGTFLTEKFFIYYGILQLVGIFGLSVHLLLFVYFPGLVVFVFWAYSDRLSLLRAFSDARVHAPDNMMLFESKEILVETIPAPGIIHAIKVDAELPGFRCLSSERATLTCSNEQGQAGGDRIVFSGLMKIKGILLGREKIESIYLFCDSRFRFWTRVVSVKNAEHTIQINPRLKKLSDQEFYEIARRNQVLLGQRLRMRGQGADQYYTSRKFQYPDSLRYIDQKRTAKFGDIMTKTFEEMRNHRLIIALDLGRAMSGEIAGSSKHDFYIAAALTLAKNAIQSRDSVDFFAFSQKVHVSLPNARSMLPFRVLVEKTEKLQPRMEETNYSLLPKMIATLTGQRSIVILLTDLSRPSVQQSLLNSLSPLCRKHLVAAVGLVDNDYSLDTQVMNFHDPRMTDHDISTLLYNYWLQERLRLFQRQLARIGGASFHLSEENWLSVVERLYGGLRQSLFA